VAAAGPVSAADEALVLVALEGELAAGASADDELLVTLRPTFSSMRTAPGTGRSE